MVRHMVMFRLAPGVKAIEVREILDTLPERIAEIGAWEVGIQEAPDDGTGDYWDIVLVSDFEDWDTLERYANDSYHHSIIEKTMPMVSERAVVDFERAAGRK